MQQPHAPATVLRGTPIGALRITADDAGVTGAEFLDAIPASEPSRGEGAAFDHAQRFADELAAYFDGRLREFTTPLAPRGTPFRQRVWAELRTIPYGVTISYAELAVRVGDPAAVRAVAGANASNPIPIAVPCHRVIGTDGTLTGYAGGLHRKRFLLDLETARAPLFAR